MVHWVPASKAKNEKDDGDDDDDEEEEEEEDDDYACYAPEKGEVLAVYADPLQHDDGNAVEHYYLLKCNGHYDVGKERGHHMHSVHGVWLDRMWEVSSGVAFQKGDTTVVDGNTIMRGHVHVEWDGSVALMGEGMHRKLVGLGELYFGDCEEERVAQLVGRDARSRRERLEDERREKEKRELKKRKAEMKKQKTTTTPDDAPRRKRRTIFNDDEE